MLLVLFVLLHCFFACLVSLLQWFVFSLSLFVVFFVSVFVRLFVGLVLVLVWSGLFDCLVSVFIGWLFLLLFAAC